MTEVVLFGGTTEGRELARLLTEKKIPTLVCVATEYGREQLFPAEEMTVRCGRLDAREMAALLRREAPRLVIDATHPYAVEVSRNIRAACGECGLRCLRVRREEQPAEGCALFCGTDALVAWLNRQPGVIFSSLGAKEAAALTAVRGFETRVWLRILPAPAGLSDCLALGYPAQHILCMQGPFSEEMNAAMFRATGAEILITKASGEAGGFSEKIAAARRRGVCVAVLMRPEEPEGLTALEIRRKIEDGNL